MKYHYWCADRVPRDEAEDPWEEFTKLAKESQAVNFGQGFPDCPPPECLAKALQQVSMVGSHEFHQEADTFVIIIEPFFDLYNIHHKLMGCIPVYCTMNVRTRNVNGIKESYWHLDLDDLERKFTSKTKLFYLNNPHNPTGKVYTKDELMKIASMVEKYDVLVVTDEVYEWITFDENEMIKFATLPGMWERTLTLGSLGKSFGVTGWKTGWIIGPEDLLSVCHSVHMTLVQSCSTPLQVAAAMAFEHENEKFGTSESWFYKMKADLHERLARILLLLKNLGFNPIKPQGSYFIMADYTGIQFPLDSKNTLTKDFQFSHWLCKSKKIVAIPPSIFYSNRNRKCGENFLRFCFYKCDKTFEEAEANLRTFKT